MIRFRSSSDRLCQRVIDSGSGNSSCGASIRFSFTLASFAILWFRSNITGGAVPKQAGIKKSSEFSQSVDTAEWVANNFDPGAIHRISHPFWNQALRTVR